jgi:hypothetical protein
MRKLSQKLILLTVLTVAVGALSLPTEQVDAAPAKDCDIIGALCRLTSSTNYQICLIKGGAPDECAWKEAEETINCLRTAGCGDLPKGPGDN